MIKMELYPKTERVRCVGDVITITEKLDGSNLAIFKLNNEIYFAQRNNIIQFCEFEENKGLLYKGLYGWANEHIEELKKELYEGSCLCGEWLGMGKLKYTVDEFDKRFYMFAKARIEVNSHIEQNFDARAKYIIDFKLTKICYSHETFIYPFENKIIPNFIGIVPKVATIRYIPDKNALDKIYDSYKEKVKRDVEGFVLDYKNNISKYVRMKNGKMQEHFDRTEG